MDKSSISSDLIRGHIDTIILHSLTSGDKYAQQISDFVNEKSGGEYQLNQATLYSSIKRLETLGYVKVYWHDSESGRRKYINLTDLGKSTVEENLSNWSYSRKIIDKLMDVEPETKIVREIVQPENNVILPESVKNEILQPTVSPSANLTEEEKRKIAENYKNLFSDSNTSENENTSTYDEVKVEPDTKEKPVIQEKQETEIPTTNQEINFRNILNGLIKTQKKEKNENIELEPLNKDDLVKDDNNDKIFENTKEKQDFNETITEKEYSKNVSSRIGNIDFSDLQINANKDGYKLRISNKEKLTFGSVYINKVRTYCAYTLFLLALIEILIYNVCFKSYFTVPAWLNVVLIISFAAFPVIINVIYLKNKAKTCKFVRKDSILTAAIIGFNGILITFVIDLLSGLNFSDTKSVILGLVLPIIFFVDCFLYFVLRYALSKRKSFTVKKQ